jgi:DNA-binding response OmpR family regulator
MDDNTKKPRVLFVEDDLGLAALFQIRMEAEGFAVTLCNDGESALQTARNLKPDLILLDLMMPKLDGFAALDLFRHTLETEASKIVIMSALSQKEDIDKAMALGADDYIVKSQVIIDEVMDRLRKLLGLPPSTLSEAANAGRVA